MLSIENGKYVVSHVPYDWEGKLPREFLNNMVLNVHFAEQCFCP
jgi:hypothetical protein